MKFHLRTIIVTIFLITMISGCAKKESPTAKATDPKDALMYTFDMDNHEYRFRLLNGWIKFPDKDSKIAFLVANKDKKSFMTAGFEPVDKRMLSQYLEEFETKLNDNDAKITVEPKKTKLNGLDAVHLGFELKDAKQRTLTYRTYLIETKDYFINLGAWTSESKPSSEIIKELDTILGTFEQLK
ncbi:hypothetical protein ACWOAH_01875 [Vagococcus vulneris]|uniref:Lipoprotein n=1 Tax=Vagococcus vulneris TaxID=1977869 RepID=A0A430A196_9ENTE|nr:hypothetical protein [Vagococcus vulneris]RSU00181.1 hypothetical protein CBF37_02470 [Vagococcus vulneris]